MMVEVRTMAKDASLEDLLDKEGGAENIPSPDRPMDDRYPEPRSDLKSMFKIKHWYWAVAVFAFLVLSLPFPLSKNVETADALYEKHYEPFPATSISRTADSDNTAQYLASHMEKAHTKAIPEIKKHFNLAQNLTLKAIEESLKQVPKESKSSLIYLSIAYLEMDSLSKAEAVFNTIIQGGKDEFLKQHATWYQGLTALKQGKTIKAKGIFNTNLGFKCRIGLRGSFFFNQGEHRRDSSAIPRMVNAE